MDQGKPAFRVIDGARPSDFHADRIAISLVVYERKRLDVPVSDVVYVEAFATHVFSVIGQGPVTFDMPHVDIGLTPRLQKKLHDFTRDIVNEVMEVHVGNRCVTRPVVREPLGSEPSFQISVGDFAEAQALAEELRTGWRPVRAVE